MLKKIAWLYSIVAAATLLLALLAGGIGTDSDPGFLLLGLASGLLLLLIWTSPLWLLVLVLVIATRSGPLKELFARAERFHTGNH